MTRKQAVDPTIAQAEHLLKEVYLPRILDCLKELSVATDLVATQ